MKGLLVPIILEAPILMTGVGNGEENSSRTLPYIPGSALRGVLAARYQQKHHLPDLAGDDTSKRLFFSQEVKYLNAYPALNSQNSRALPTPASWRKRKEDGYHKVDVVDFALDEEAKFNEAVKKPFCSPEADNGQMTYFEPDEELAIHIAGQERGTVKQQNNTVFQYQALARDQVFVAVILAADAKDQTVLKTLLDDNSHVYLGRSRSARYGLARLGEIKPIENWEEGETNEAGEVTVLTLLSDALLRDAHGQPTHNLDIYLSLKFGRKITSSQAFAKTTLVGGFNRKWGLPLPQFPALGMGSVFVYSEGTFSQKEVDTLTQEGVGERRTEGYGRVIANWPGVSKFVLDEASPSKKAPFSHLSQGSEQFAKKIGERILRKRLDTYLLEEAQNYTITGNLNNHQLSRLRIILRQEINGDAKRAEPVQEFLNSLKPTARDQYERSRIHRLGMDEHPRLYTWLEEKLTEKDGLSAFSNSRIPEVAGQTGKITDAIKLEYTLRLIEMVINRRMKENREVNP